MASQPRRFTIGYALASKKKSSFIQDSLLSLAASRGIDLLQIDLDKSLLDQGPFDCIIHKLQGDPWKSRLEEFSSEHPHVPIVDPLDLIERLRNRVSMLEVVSNLSVVSSPCGDLTFGVPKQVVVLKQEELLDGNVDEAFGLRFPMIAKPLLSDGSETSHKMALVFRREGVPKLSAPIVLQEFVNHGGVIFKVYVAGDHVNCVIRNSLPDMSEEIMECAEGLVLFSQISNLPRKDSVEEKRIDDPQMPPRSFVMDIAMELRRELGLNLFNFDVIRDVKVGNHYLVIDINYFPGFAKMPSYETMLTDFFWDTVNKNTRGCSSDSTGNDALELETKSGVNLDTERKDLANDGEDGSKANADPY